jgi:translation initiation factor 1
MGRGTKLDLQIGADFDEGWQQIDDVQSVERKTLLAPEAHRLVFKKEKRRGKPVTLVGPFALDQSDASALLKQWKKKLGCGGTLKDEWMEFQGDLAASLRPLLAQDGFALK